MLLDSARIQESDAQWKAKKNKRSGDPTEDALYTVQDATDTLELLVPVSYGDHVELSRELRRTGMMPGTCWVRRRSALR